MLIVRESNGEFLMIHCLAHRKTPARTVRAQGGEENQKAECGAELPRISFAAHAIAIAVESRAVSGVI